MSAQPGMGDPGETGRFGEFGGRYIPETLVGACAELDAAFREAFSKGQFFGPTIRDRYPYRRIERAPRPG